MMLSRLLELDADEVGAAEGTTHTRTYMYSMIYIYMYASITFYIMTT